MVENEKLEAIIKAGTYAATGMGKQAPVILIVLADKEVPTYQYDGSLVLGNLMNAAESLEVSSIWIHRAKEEFRGYYGSICIGALYGMSPQCVEYETFRSGKYMYQWTRIFFLECLWILGRRSWAHIFCL